MSLQGGQITLAAQGESMFQVTPIRFQRVTSISGQRGLLTPTQLLMM